MTQATLQTLLPLPVVMPIVGAVAALLLARLSTTLALVLSVASMAATAVVLALFAPSVYGGHVVSQFLGHWGPVHGQALGVAFDADPFGLTFALLTAGVGTVLLLHTLSELRGLGSREIGGYACLFQLLLAALIGSALTADTVDLFVWFEVAALASYGLTAFLLERPLSVEAGFKIMVLTNMAGFWVFTGAAMIYSHHGALNVGQLGRVFARPGAMQTPDLIALALLVAGFGTKAGLVPFHGWLADAHTAAPGPVSALFSGLMVNLGVVAIARVALEVYDGGARPLLGLLTALGALSAVLGAVMALMQDELKRLLAYDTVSQMGVLIVGVGTGTTDGLAGMTYHLINHALFKSLLFLCAGAVVHATGMTKLSEMGGLARHRPWTTGAFLVGVAAISGIPPLNGYVSVGLIHDALRDDHPFVFAVMILAQVLTIAALLRATYLGFFRRRDDDYDTLERPGAGMAVSFGALSLGCLLFGIFPTYVLDHVAAPAAAALTHPHLYASAVLAGHGRLPVPSVSFDYWSGSELGTALGTLAAGIVVGAIFVRLHDLPRPLALLRRLHTGSVNDYATYSILGLVIVMLVLVSGL